VPREEPLDASNPIFNSIFSLNDHISLLIGISGVKDLGSRLIKGDKFIGCHVPICDELKTMVPTCCDRLLKRYGLEIGIQLFDFL